MGFHPASKRGLSDTAWIIYYSFFVHEHVYTTKTLEKKLEKITLYKEFTNKNFKYIPVHWDKCQAKSGKLMFMANHTIVDWGPHGIRLSNCSDDITTLHMIILLK